MKYFKPILFFAICLLLYFVPAFLFKADSNYYTSLHLPAYAPPAILFIIIWPILYIIFSLYLSIQVFKHTLSKEMLVYFIINYIVSFFFNKVFFIEHNLFLSFAVTFMSFITGLFLFITSFKKEFLIFLPYILWTGFASVLMAHIYMIN